MRSTACLCGIALAVVATARPARAWTPSSQVAIAEAAARLAPPDLRRQIQRHWRDYRQGVLEAGAERDGWRHVKNPDGSGELDRAALGEAAAAVAMIRAHRPFAEIVRQLGRAAHFVADANNPLNTAASDAQEERYFADYLRYVDSARGRFALVYYGAAPPEIEGVLAAALRRGRTLYPFVGMEYRRIGLSGLDGGVAGFDDRSTAFAVAAVSFSHALSDVAAVLRQVWLAGGGGDERPARLAEGDALLLLPAAGGGR